MKFLYRHFKVFRLDAKLHDAAGVVRAHSGKNPGYCYIIGRWPNSCLPGHVTGLLICIYVKLFLTSIFNSVDFWSSMSCILLDIELAGENVIKESGVFIDGRFQGYSLFPPKNYKPQNKLLGHMKFASNCVEQWTFGLQWAFKHSSLCCNGWILCKRNGKCKILGNLINEVVESLEDHGLSKVQDLVDEKIWICSGCSFRHKTTRHCRA